MPASARRYTVYTSDSGMRSVLPPLTLYTQHQGRSLIHFSPQLNANTLRGIGRVVSATKTGEVASVQLRVVEADFSISLPAPSADTLHATLYGHSTWRPLSRAER
jgi:hypothetical protein